MDDRHISSKEVIMSAQAIGTIVEGKETGGRIGWASRLGLFGLFLMGGLAIFVFGSGYFAIFPTNNNPLYLAGLSALFLIVAVFLKQNARLEKYWRAAFAFFTASAALLFSTLMARLTGAFLGALNLTTSTSQGIAIAKSYEMVMIVVAILLLTRLSGADLGSLYLRRGNLKWGLSIGLLVLFNFASSAFLFFAARYSSVDSLGAAVLWGLVFSFANGFMEELWMRGVFLKRLEPLLGLGGAVLLTSIVFSSAHVGAVYVTPVAIPFMLAYALTLGIACGYLIMKTGSLWGATLIHAAADLFLFIAMLANA
jgi:membrane protease YdiL (CAAX protease family)